MRINTKLQVDTSRGVMVNKPLLVISIPTGGPKLLLYTKIFMNSTTQFILCNMR